MSEYFNMLPSRQCEHTRSLFMCLFVFIQCRFYATSMSSLELESQNPEDIRLLVRNFAHPSCI